MELNLLFDLSRRLKQVVQQIYEKPPAIKAYRIQTRHFNHHPKSLKTVSSVKLSHELLLQKKKVFNSRDYRQSQAAIKDEEIEREIRAFTWRAPTTVLQLSCCCDPENRVPMYSMAIKYLWILGFGVMASSDGFSDLEILEGFGEGEGDSRDRLGS